MMGEMLKPDKTGIEKNGVIKTVVYAVLIIVPLILISVCLFYTKNTPDKAAESMAEITEEKEPEEITIKQKKRENLIVSDTTISCEIIEDKLNDMGFLVTETYYFRELLNDIKENKIFGIKYGKESYTVSYEGDVTAGIDFSLIKVTRDEKAKSIKVMLPESEIFKVNVDPNSFMLLDEKKSVFNEFTISDFNEAQKGLVENAKERALNRGLLRNADENARNVIRAFIAGFTDTGEYTVIFETAAQGG